MPIPAADTVYDSYMGTRGPIPTEGSVRDQKRESRGEIVHVRPGVVIAPTPDQAWSPIVVEQWETFWASDIAARLLAEVDLAPIRRLFNLYHLYEAALDQYLAGGQLLAPVNSDGTLMGTHPLFSTIKALHDMIVKLEDRFGITPHSRMRLGLKVAKVAEAHERANATVTRKRRGE